MRKTNNVKSSLVHEAATDLLNARRAANQLTVYRGLHQEGVVKQFLALLDLLIFSPNSELELLDAYHSFINGLILAEPPGSWPDAWQRYLVSAVLLDENPFSLKMEHMAYEEISCSLNEAVKRDLHSLQRLCQVDAGRMRQAVTQRIYAKDWRIGEEELIDWGNMIFSITPESEISRQLLASNDWSREVSDLACYYCTHGAGQFARFSAFRWESREGKGTLVSLGAPDNVSFDQLVDYQAQKHQLLTNTEHFMAGLPASNVLLYGSRGTGKSSMVKALLNRYSSRGLRLVEVAKENLAELPQIIGGLRHRAFRFIIFVDDLSFEEYEVEYKGLKAVLEGGIETLPENVLVYATSNRRHLIREYFQDREPGDEIHRDETVQEKLSFADRFGVTIFFPSPSQQVYLRMVEEMMRERGIVLEQQELHDKALKWEKQHNGLSGRTARQFVDRLTAETMYKVDMN